MIIMAANTQTFGASKMGRATGLSKIGYGILQHLCFDTRITS